MDYDPLSAPTRRTRRALLAVASATILANIFCAQVDGLPLSGISLSFDDALVNTALISTLAYLTVSFVIYAKIDWTNRGRTPAQIAESDARKAILIEVERAVKAVANQQIVRQKQSGGPTAAVQHVVDVFWRFKSKPDVDPDTLRAALMEVFVGGDSFSALEEVMRESWNAITTETTAERNRAIASKRQEKRRFFALECALPMLIAAAAIFVFFTPDWTRGWLGMDLNCPTANTEGQRSAD